MTNRPTETTNDLGQEMVATNGYETDDKSTMNPEGAEVDVYQSICRLNLILVL